MKWLVGIGILAALVVAVLLGLKAAAPVAIPARSSVPFGKPSTGLTRGPSPDSESASNHSAGPVGNATKVDPMPPLSGPEQIEAWLSSSTDVPTITTTILTRFASLDPKDHLLAVAKLAPRVGDDRYEGLKRLLVDRNTSLEAKEFLFRDAFNRSTEVKLPAMFAVMTTPGHPQAAEAREALINHLGADYGANQGQWLASIQANLKERAQVGK